MLTASSVPACGERKQSRRQIIAQHDIDIVPEMPAEEETVSSHSSRGMLQHTFFTTIATNRKLTDQREEKSKETARAWRDQDLKWVVTVQICHYVHRFQRTAGVG